MTIFETHTGEIVQDMPVVSIDYFLNKLTKAPLAGNSKAMYYQIPMGFDIEASSFTINNEKYATMYIWQMCTILEHNYYYIYGRNWYEWELLIHKIRIALDLTHNNLVIYVHNLGYEFQWIYTHLFFTKIFARKRRHPIYCQTDGLIFKCSYFLSNYSLRNLAKTRGYTLKEEMDYSLLRTSVTKLTFNELKYSLTDVKILCEYISDEIKRNETIQNIPLTSTGYVRRYCYEFIKNNENIISYQNWLRSIFPSDPNLFKLLYQGYSGAFTHANYKHVHITLENLHCIDYSSDYPGIMCRKKFPMGFHKADPTKLRFFSGKAQIMRITFNKIEATTNHSIISRHKCTKLEHNTEMEEIVDNGRIRQAYSLTITITDLDFDIIKKFYKWESYIIDELWVADYRYLPKNLILSVLHLYANKTKLKNVIGKEEEYLRSKELINAVYGMSVTNPVNDEIIFEMGEWLSEDTDVDSGLKAYKNRRTIFTVYQWGVWVTAWARWELLNTVYKMKNDAVYSDTDSIKFLNDHTDIIKQDNKRIIEENNAVINYYKLEESLFYPKTIEGKIKPLGIWDFEPDYKYFKTLGAKRYCFSYNDEYFEKNKEKLKTNVNFFITVAGLSKDAGKQAILNIAKKYDLSPYDVFAYDCKEISSNYVLTITEDESDKQCFSYISQPFKLEVIDYQGNKSVVSETSYVNSENIPFAFNSVDEYLQLLGLIKTGVATGGTVKHTKMNQIGTKRSKHNEEKIL